jgi:GH15 family glucan-1,4-alpha-glucosidase
MRLEQQGLVGNCQYSALIGADGNVAWCCFPRFDSEPVFGSLLDPDGGCFTIGPAAGGTGSQRYLENTNVLETRFEVADGVFRVLDFAPRFVVHGRTFRPTKLVRIIEPIEGTPRVRVQCNPVLGWSKHAPSREPGSHHIDFLGYPAIVRLTTDVPLAYVDGTSFALSTRQHLVFAWGAPVEEPLRPLCDRFLTETVAHWREWVKHCSVPVLFQREVIRSALALKLHCYEDTGAIVAALTTSLPESPGSGRTWDYRYCWLRDAYYVLGAFELLGQFIEREQFLHYLLTVASSAEDLDLSPLYRIDATVDLEERILPEWQGYEGHGPVRTGNGAASQVQNDIYGELVLSLTPLFLDERFRQDQNPATLTLMTRLARKAIAVAGRPDAGIWEYRLSEQTPQSFSMLMCWAGADRMRAVAERHAPDLVPEFAAGAERIREQLIAGAWNEDLGTFTGSFGGRDLDASMLQAITLRLLATEDPRAGSTIDVIGKGLMDHGWMYRYRMYDGLGTPDITFVICTFWMVEALARMGRMTEARELLGRVANALPPLGLMSEDFDPETERFWGNFPQAYSHVGLIRAAFAASPSWSDVL